MELNTPSLSADYVARFGGIARLYGSPALEALASAHFVVVGLGGVGTWAAEALARSGVGTLTLIELDEVCTTNTNRQIHALTGNVGQSKNALMAQRIKCINPDIQLHCIEDFLTKSNIETYISEQHHIVVDAIDSVHVKAALAAFCSRRKIRLICCGSSGGKIDPSQVTVADLGCTQADPLLAKMRNLLHHSHNFARNKNRRYRIDAVYSAEPMLYPKPDGSVCNSKAVLQEGVKLDCAGGFGSATMVTGTFGFVCAAKAIERYLQKALAP